MISFRTKASARRAVFLRLAFQVEGQLRDAYARRFHEKKATQASIAKELGVGRSVIHRRLTGRTNMRIETVADMVWALDCDIDVRIADRQAPSALPDDSALPAGGLDEKLIKAVGGTTQSAPFGDPGVFSTPGIRNGYTLVAA